MDRFAFVWSAAASFTKLTLSITEKDSEQNYPLDQNIPPKEQILEWISKVGWEKLSCMDESMFLLEKQRIEWQSEREESPNCWMDLLAAMSFLYEKSVERGEPTNLIWDHILSLVLSAWESEKESHSIKNLAQTSDSELEGSELRFTKEAIRSLQRIRKAEMDPEADTKIGEGDDAGEGAAESEADGLDDDILLGLQSKMKEMLSKIQDPKNGLGKLMGEIMEDLKHENIDLDPKTMMDMAMKGMMGGIGKGQAADMMKDGPFGKIMSIVERKVKEKIEGGGMDELKNILESTKELFGKDPQDMKETLMKVLQGMVKKMGLPKQAQGLIFSKMNKIIQTMTESFMNQDGPAPQPEQMQEMLAKSMDSVMKDFARQQGQKVSGRKAQRMASRMQHKNTARDPRLDRLEKLKERLRQKRKNNKKDDDNLQ